MKNKLKFLLKPNFVFFLYMLVTVVASLQKIFKEIPNNYLIFKYSFLNLIYGIDLYSLHPEQHYDYYKYSPVFTLLMAPFTLIPDFVGALLWNVLNVFVFFMGVKSLELDNKYKAIFLWLCLFEVITSINYFQSNLLLAGLMLLVLSYMQKSRVQLSGLMSVILFNIKIFGAGVASIFLLYPNKLKFIFSSLIYFVVLVLVTVLASSYDYMYAMYASWLGLLFWDFDASLGLSVMSWFSFIPKLWIQVFATLLVFLPILISWIKKYKLSPYMLTASIMLWSVIFNHKAETATYIIAVTGATLYYAYSRKNILDKILISLVFVLTTLSPTELFPKFILPYLGGKDFVKLLPCFLVWLKLSFEIWTTLWSGARRQHYR